MIGLCKTNDLTLTTYYIFKVGLRMRDHFKLLGISVAVTVAVGPSYHIKIFKLVSL